MGVLCCGAARLPLLPESKTLLAGKSMVTSDTELGFGVISKVYAAPKPAKLLAEPPPITRSLSVKPVTGSEKVMLALNKEV